MTRDVPVLPVLSPLYNSASFMYYVIDVLMEQHGKEFRSL
jgi:hypothetical protein